MKNNSPRLVLGKSDFKALRQAGDYFVDKSLLIEDVINGGHHIMLITRPRRFGKTVNLSMMRYFFDQSDRNNRSLFNGLAIANRPSAMGLQGKYPTLFVSFKDIRGQTFQESLEAFQRVLADLYQEHFEKIESSLEKIEIDFCQKITQGKA